VSSLEYWVWLSSLSGVRPDTALHLLKHFGTPEQVFFAEKREYTGVEGVKPSDVAKLSGKNIDEASRILDSCEKIGCRVITLKDSVYPERLRNIFDPPVVLYVQGNLPDIDDEPVVAVIGTRDCTQYGLSAAEGISYELSRRGLIVATGLASGVDSAAARGALRAGGAVLGVIGTGLDIVYPSENKALFKEVAVAGAIISEYSPGTHAYKSHFPARNRIISGISLGVAVIEAPKRSGALITAARALEQGRDVFTLPGNIGAVSCEGSNALLREGAIPILSADDIISEYAELFPEKITRANKAESRPHTEQNPESQDNTALRCDTDSGKRDKKEIDNVTGVDYIDLDKILAGLQGDERTAAETIGLKTMQVNDIIVISGMTAQQVLTALTMLEIKGLAVRLESGEFKILDTKS